MIDVRRQSGTHIEAKMTLAIPKEKKNIIEVKYYLFTPAHLHITGENYTTQHFLTKLQSHGRYSSPELTLSELLDRSNELSMLTILERYTAVLASGEDSVETTKFISELQELVNSVRHITKHSVRSYRRMHNISPDEEIEKELSAYINGMKDFRTRFFEIMKKIRDKKSTLKQYWTGMIWADEAISLLIEENAVQLFRVLKEDAKSEKCRIELQKIGQLEQEHRRTEEYESADPRFELFSLRKADLKKWSQSVMYLRPKYSRLPKQIGQICAGIAAAIAMTFATVASILAENVYLKNSLQWALVVIIAYVFKDRIKEWLRILLTRFIPRLMADEMYTLNSPRHGVPLAKCRNIVAFSTPSKIDEDVLIARKKGSNPFYDMLPEENILIFTRDITLLPSLEKFETVRPWVKRLAIIDRINIGDFLKEMDDSSAVQYYTGSDSIDSVEVIKNYAIHLMVEAKYSEGESELTHYQVLANKNGIVRIEQI